MNTPTIIADFPAYQIIETPEAKTFWSAGDVFAIPFNSRSHGTLYHFFTLGSAASYALKYGEDPIRAHEQAIERGHKTHWANSNSVSITNSPRPKETVIGLNFGDVIHFEGHEFRLEKAPNDNVNLVEVGA